MTLDPRIGRWLEEDPIGLSGGDANLYRYVGNDPTNAIDPTGMYLITTEANSGKIIANLKKSGAKYAEPVKLPSGKVYIHTDSRDRDALSDYADKAWPKVFDDQRFDHLEDWKKVLSLRNTFLRASGFLTDQLAEAASVDPLDPKLQQITVDEKDEKAIKDFRTKLFGGGDFKRPSVRIDFGGEGRHSDAININIQYGKTTTPRSFKGGNNIPNFYCNRSVNFGEQL